MPLEKTQKNTLRTLKDIIKPIELKRYSRKEIPIIIINKFYDDLRTEAIKHILDLRQPITVDTKIKDKSCGHNTVTRYNYFDHCLICDSWIYTGKYEQTQTEGWIKHFFNITEEDLK